MLYLDGKTREHGQTRETHGGTNSAYFKFCSFLTENFSEHFESVLVVK